MINPSDRSGLSPYGIRRYIHLSLLIKDDDDDDDDDKNSLCHRPLLLS